MNCEEVEELAGAYALQALPLETMRQVEEHLASCSAHPDIAGLRAIALSLAMAAPEREPPPALRARLMQAIGGESAGATPSVPQMAPSTPARGWSWPRLPSWRWLRPSPYSFAAVLAIAVVALLAWNVLLQISQDGDQETFVRTLADGGVASGRIVYIQEEGVALLTVEGLAPLPAEKTYQVWAISDGGATGIGLFNASANGEATAVMEVDLSGVEVVAITIEPAGGSPQPTTEPVLKAEI